jgi:hypothetical protein
MHKLTAVSLYFRGRRYTRFLWLEQNSDGKGAIIPEHILNAWLDSLKVQRGQTYSIG